MIKLFLSINAVFFMSITFATQAFANDRNQTIMVLDASGSMWGQIEGKTKIEIARDVIAETVGTWDQDQPLGLVAYGHNRKGDCGDIELLIKPSKVNAAQFSAVANTLSPKGKTPLSAAVKMAAENMNYTEGKATVILVSDGKETCDLDPCSVGESLEHAGIDFTAHIIGFDVSKEDSVGLRCLASKTGGAYLDAKDAEQLKTALQQTADVITDTGVIEKTVATVTTPVEVFAGSSFEVKWTGPKNVSDYLVVQSEDASKSFNVAYVGADNIQSPTIMVAPEEAGSYRVHYHLKDKTSLASDRLLVITPNATVDAPETVIAGQPFSVGWTGPKNEFDSLRIYNLEGKTTHIYAILENRDFTTPTNLAAPIDVGEYEIRYQTLGQKVLAKDSFKVLPAVATVSLAKEVAAGSPFEVRWTGPSNKHDRLRVLDSTGKRLNNYKTLQKKNVTNVVEMTAPGEPGEYWLAYDASSQKILAQATFTVTPVIAMISGPNAVKSESDYEVTWSGPNYKGDSIYTFSSDGKDMREYKFLGKKDSASPITLTAPKQPGTYELRYQIKGRTVIATHRFVVN